MISSVSYNVYEGFETFYVLFTYVFLRFIPLVWTLTATSGGISCYTLYAAVYAITLNIILIDVSSLSFSAILTVTVPEPVFCASIYKRISCTPPGYISASGLQKPVTAPLQSHLQIKGVSKLEETLTVKTFSSFYYIITI